MQIMRIATAIVATGIMAASAHATVTTYTSRASFDAAAGATTTSGFDEGNSTLHYHVAPNPYMTSGITFTDNVTTANVLDGGTPILFLIGNATTPAYGVDFLSFQNTDVGISADITFAGLTAFGFEYASYIVAGAATVAIDGGTPTAIAVTGAPTFIGFTSDTPITDISLFFPTGYSFDLTSITYGATTASVPEPASWAMLVGGFGLIGGTLRRGGRGAIRAPLRDGAAG